MTALGLETHVSKFIQAGIKPLVLGLILFAWLFLRYSNALMVLLI
ncbi:hypothetical protein ACP8HZ_08770 [Francisella noatunensis]